MGTFAELAGDNRITDPKKLDEFIRNAKKIIHEGGMMRIEPITIGDITINTLCPLEKYTDKNLWFEYNYFEDDSWEPAALDTVTGDFHSNKIGWEQFGNVVIAIYTLKSFYTDERTIPLVDGKPFPTDTIIAWLDNVLKSDWIMHDALKRTNSPQTVETKDFLAMDESYYRLCMDPDYQTAYDYQVSDSDRLYWWEKDNGFKIDEKTKEWFNNLQELADGIVFTNEDYMDKEQVSIKLAKTLSTANEFYGRIIPFKSTVDEFLGNADDPDYYRLIRLFGELVYMNKKKGEVIGTVSGSWSLADKRKVFNEGRMIIKRFLALMANKELRREVFFV